MYPPLIFISLLLLSGCNLTKPDKPANCVELMREAARAGCQIGVVVQDDYMEKCAVACK